MKRWTFRGGAVLAGILFFGFVWLVMPLGLIGTPHSKVAFMEDRNNLRQLVGLAVESGKIPMKDGAFDPLAFVRRGKLGGSNLKLLRSNRSETGPTGEEIVRRDYTNFPWERYRGDGKLEGPAFPLLWEKVPDKTGGLLVAFSDGSVRYCDRAEVETIFRHR